jgi:hypothetical protein
LSSSPSRGLCLATLVFLAAASRAGAAEDCTDLARIPDCPPVNSGCAAWACPPQDCSTCTPGYDDDGDCAIDEELLNGIDDDNDGLADEDISCLDGCDPLSFRCPTGTIPGSLIDLPSPVEPPIAMEMLARRQPCAGPASTAALTVVMKTDPSFDAGCARWQVLITVLDATGRTELLEGPAMVVLSRRYESFERTMLSPPALGNVRVTRYTVKADLAAAVPFADLPPEIQFPCIERKYRHVFFYGTLDVATDTFDPSNRLTSLVLHHAPSSLSHPVSFNQSSLCDADTVSTRALTPRGPGSHDESFFLVAPAAGFTFATNGTALLGDYKYGRIRTVRGFGADCSMETRICVSEWELPSPPSPQSACNGQELLRHARICAGLDDSACTHLALSSDGHCATISPELVAFFPVGSWSGTLFPAPMEVSAFEGGLSCIPPAPLSPWRPYWYGTLTRLQSSGTWLGPPEALDVIDNVHLSAAGQENWLVGACNWLMEDQPGETFAPMQYGTMRFFADENPEIPRREPCEAKPVITLPSPADCTPLTSLTLPCDGAPLVLSAECATVVHCCQCGLPEVQWSRRDAAGWVVVEPWGDVRTYVEDPPPLRDTDYKLELRCTTSRRACVGETVLTVTHPPVFAAAHADAQSVCPGQQVRLDAGACPGCTCTWTADVGPDPRDACTIDVAPQVSTTYTVVVVDSLTGCASDPASVDVHVSSLAADAGPDIFTCGCQPVTLTGSASGCAGPLEYRWHRIAPMDEWICGDAATWLPESPGLTCPTSACGGTFELSVRCSNPPQCTATDRVVIVVEERPTLGAVLAVDPSPCARGIDVSWEPAVFPSGSGTYAVYRSEIDCADAVAEPPLAVGIAGLTYTDSTTADGHSYTYAVLAEDSVPTTSCVPAGPLVGGAVALSCAARVDEVGPAPPPVWPCWTLRARHVGDVVTMDWSLAHPLNPGEHFHLLKAAPDPRGPFPMIDPEGDLSLTWTETDVATRVQFFDLRIANRCEIVSGDDEPPGFDLARSCP